MMEMMGMVVGTVGVTMTMMTYLPRRRGPPVEHKCTVRRSGQIDKGWPHFLSLFSIRWFQNVVWDDFPE